jgi:hypothetical protein
MIVMYRDACLLQRLVSPRRCPHTAEEFERRSTDSFPAETKQQTHAIPDKVTVGRVARDPSLVEDPNRDIQVGAAALSGLRRLFV